MSYFRLSNGDIATGKKESAFLSDFGIIPNGTLALAAIERVEEKTFQDEVLLQISWRLMNAPFANRIVTQKLKVGSANAATADRAKEMLLLIFETCRVTMQDMHQGPNSNDFMALQSKICGILIREWQMDGKEGNFVAEVHPSFGFLEAVGMKLEARKAAKSKSNLIDERNPPFVDDTLIF